MKAINLFVITLVFLVLVGCSETYLEEAPPHLLSSELLLQNYDGFEAALNGLYNVARHARWQSEKLENALNGVDNMCSNYTRSDIFWNWGPVNSPDDKDLKETWAWLYEIVYSANNIITFAKGEDVDFRGGSGTAEENKNRIVAEARALRAWAYRRLAYSWGDVPLSLELITGIVTDWERAPVAQVRAQMIADFTFAQQYVPTEASRQGRITKGAVQTLLAETYLTIGKPDSALYWADQAINNPAYKLVTERYGVFKDDPEGSAYGDMFKHTSPESGNQNREDGNTEALWVFQFNLYDVDGQGHELSRAITGNYNQIIISFKRPLSYKYHRGGRGKSYFGCTKWWVDSFEPQDVRGQNYILRKYFILGEDAVNNERPDTPPEGMSFGDTIWCDWSQDIDANHNGLPDWPYSRKGEGTDPMDMAADFAWSDQIYIRLADTYLLKAEAEFKLGRSADAAATINIIRERAKASLITAADVNMDFILDERSRELYPEEERRYTLLRTGKWLERTAKYNKFGGDLISPRDTLFPIPQTVIDANLTGDFPQNPGW